jgi:hypothetical protein
MTSVTKENWFSLSNINHDAFWLKPSNMLYHGDFGPFLQLHILYEHMDIIIILSD